MNTNTVPLSSCFYHFGTFIIPAGTPDPQKDPTQKCLVANITGTGQVDALCYRTNYYGVWFGYEIDDYPLDLAHNGDCLQNMGLIGAAATGMPYYLPYYNGPEDLSIACRLPLKFNKSFKLWMGNSHPLQSKDCIGLHMYVTGYDIQPVEGNMLDWSLVLPERHPYTCISAEVITLQRYHMNDK